MKNLNKNNFKPEVYLIGGWSDWRDKVIMSITNCKFLDPRITINEKHDYIDQKDNWFETEIAMIKRSDCAICWMTKDNSSGFGTTFELGMCFALNKPYILINEIEDKYKWAMQTKGAVKHFTNLESALKWIKRTNWMNIKIKK